jgi:hypothetical protein
MADWVHPVVRRSHPQGETVIRHHTEQRCGLLAGEGAAFRHVSDETDSFVKLLHTPYVFCGTLIKTIKSFLRALLSE